MLRGAPTLAGTCAERYVQAVIDKMLGCGTVEAGYTTYLCPHCLEEKRVAFSWHIAPCGRALQHQCHD
jgi:Transposase zinc-binding domain